jgi:integrase
MKAGKEHRVPLSGPALTLLRDVAGLREGDDPQAFLFPSTTAGKPLSLMAMTMTLRRMKRADVTVHGFRSTFRDWTAEQTTTQREVAEAALAHAIPDRTEAAYRRGDLFDRRTKLMEAWGRYCTAPAASVVQMPRAVGGVTP